MGSCGAVTWVSVAVLEYAASQLGLKKWSKIIGPGFDATRKGNSLDLHETAKIALALLLLWEHISVPIF